jgi:hypothetical protein
MSGRCGADTLRNPRDTPPFRPRGDLPSVLDICCACATRFLGVADLRPLIRSEVLSIQSVPIPMPSATSYHLCGMCCTGPVLRQTAQSASFSLGCPQPPVSVQAQIAEERLEHKFTCRQSSTPAARFPGQDWANLARGKFPSNTLKHSLLQGVDSCARESLHLVNPAVKPQLTSPPAKAESPSFRRSTPRSRTPAPLGRWPCRPLATRATPRSRRPCPREDLPRRAG